MKLENAKLSNVDRTSRIALGFALIGLAYFGSGPLYYLALLPLFAIYPLMTAFLGHCPLEGAVRESLQTRGVAVPTVNVKKPLAHR